MTPVSNTPDPGADELGAFPIRIRVVGGPTAAIELFGLRLLTDPTFSPAGVHESAPGRPLTKTEDPALAMEQIGAIDLVLLSHDQHADNLDPAGRQFLESVPMTLTTQSAADRLGGRAHALATWERMTVPGEDGSVLEVTAVPARHGPAGCEPLTGEVTGFVLRGEELPSVYVSGDNASLDAVQAIATEFGQVDMALLFAGAARTSLLDGAALTLTSNEVVAAAVLLGARWVVPLHVRGWAHFSEGPDEVERAFEVAGLDDRLRLVDPGRTAGFPP